MSLKTGIRHNTQANYNFAINIIANEDFGKKRIDTVKLSDAKGWLIKLQKDGRGYIGGERQCDQRGGHEEAGDGFSGLQLILLLLQTKIYGHMSFNARIPYGTYVRESPKIWDIANI